MSASTAVSNVILKVAEARALDVGRAMARLDPADMHCLCASAGSIVQVTGRKTTVAKVMPAFPEARGGQIVQMDGLTRSNAGATLGEKVALTVIYPPMAERVVLVRESGGFLKQQHDEHLARNLADLPVIVADRIRVTVFGSRFQEFRVTETVPQGAVLIRPETAIRIQTADKTAGAGRISYEDIGGLGPAIRRVREMIELPLRHPQVFGRLGIDAPKGVLLHGPPGCGKTLVARAVASETEAAFFSISGPEVITKYYGESEARLRQLFEQAKNQAPSIVFLDEIDAIAPKREHATGEVEKRVVAQLLALMDGLETRGQIIVIAATNLPNALDPALRRPGRFDREIMIGIPDDIGREQIFEVHTRGMPLREDVNIRRLAGVTHGFTGADVAALCREAAMAALRRALSAMDADLASVAYDQLLEIQVGGQDFLTALKEVEPSALREVVIALPEVGWDDIGGLTQVKNELREMLEWPSKFPELFAKAAIKRPKGVLLNGPPGTGKTMLAKALARESGMNFISVKGPELISKYLGESERGIRDIFRKARQAAPCMIFFDEFDSLVPRRSAGASDGNASQRVVAQLLAEIDGVEELEGVVVIAATNRADIIDPAVLRPGRFDRIVEINLPSESDRLDILRVQNRERPVAEHFDWSELARRTQGFSGARLEQLSRDAAMLAIREHISHSHTDSVLNFRITMQHFERAFLRSADGHEQSDK